ncbi:hypothetical protein KDD93_05465 [Campylobacter sp. faydin G-24]|uniref:Uncharacterized protein n=1 Tax=Campylobacter anatolicus TaxID=2829105 RepID=A0ABS5HIC0_9BACT|nr:hypothetical protein [Campylobacter anatolicus]MBR8464019.1 hypothetical protein [Campylobacter anatolicus]MBR8465793.1 hypothetical protein [Campylobacter anatolicus]
MIDKIGRISQISKTQKSGEIALNTSLPTSIKVAAKIGYNRYLLKFGNQSINTKSTKSLNVGGEYWGEIENGDGNILIKNMQPKPNFTQFNVLENGINLIEKIISEPSLDWFYEYIFSSLGNTESKDEFVIFTDMLMALQESIVHIPFVYDGHLGLFQLKKELKSSSVYLVFLNFAPIIFKFAPDFMQILTPFSNVATLLSANFNCEVTQSNVVPFWSKNEKLIDFKG